MQTDYRYITKNDKEYPERLKRYSNMPSGIYVKGSLPDADKKTVAIVGARKCSPYGQKTAYEFAKILSSHDVQVVSGLAFGIDAYSHKGCLAGGENTYAVLGCGIDICYPASNYRLYNKILSGGGGIISEYPPGSPALSYHFPIRNRIISALSDAVIVIEAKIKSGSLITASYALEQGVQIYAVPGRIDDVLSAGTNSLIFQGAVPALSAQDILYDMGLINKKREEKKSPPNDPSLSNNARSVLNIISSDPVSADIVCAKCHLDISAATQILLMLELKGYIYQPIPGLYAASYS